MINCEIRHYYDSFRCGNFTEDKTLRICFVETEENVKKMFRIHSLMGRTRIETSRTIVFCDSISPIKAVEYIYYKNI